ATPFCRDYHIKKQCSGNCGRSHNCPVTKVPLALSKEQAAGAGRATGRAGQAATRLAQRRGRQVQVPLALKCKGKGAGVPNRLVDKLKWSPGCSAAKGPGGAIVLPFAGKDDGKDLLDDALYGALCTAALQGALSFVGACPDFRTWGKVLSLPPGSAAPQPGLPRPFRAVTNLLLESWDGKFCTHPDHPKLTHSGTLGIRGRRPFGGSVKMLGFLVQVVFLPISELELTPLALPLVPEFLASTASGAKQHPFPDSVMKEIRDFILPEHSQPEAGQPFFLDVIHALLKDVRDVDSEYPITLKEGVPLGVDTPTLKSPGVWPLKFELIGEEWDPIEAPPPSGHKNYPSADVFQAEIRSTFVEETPLGMVIGPCTRAEAEELCPCPMAGIDESDKIGSIFDGSKR
ncbi:Rbm17, partial [Symbiodinium necroappetens]